MSMHPNAPLPQGPHPGPQPGGYPPPRPSGPVGPVGAIVVNLQGNRAFANLVPPSVQVDGLQFPSNYGRNLYQVPAGRRHVFVWSQWMRRYGQAAIEVDVPAGGTVELFYAAPVHQFTTGAIGFEKQKVKGMAAFWAMMAVLAVLMVAAIVVAVQNG